MKMQEVPFDRFISFREYFADPQTVFVLASIIVGNTTGRLWVNAQADSRALILWDQGNNVFYLSGELDGGAIKAFQHLIESNIRPAAIADRLSHFKARALTDSWQPAISRVFDGLAPEPKVELLYVFKKRSVDDGKKDGPRQVTLALIDAALFSRTDLTNLGQVREEIEWMWPSLDRFLDDGFGSVALLKDEIVCWCTAEYMSRKTCGIGIETISSQQNKGIATATAAHFVDHCLRRNIRPYWECWRDNLGSVRVAEKVGFEKVQEIPFWLGHFED